MNPQISKFVMNWLHENKKRVDVLLFTYRWIFLRNEINDYNKYMGKETCELSLSLLELAWSLILKNAWRWLD